MIYKIIKNSITAILIFTLIIAIPFSQNTVSASGKIYSDQEKREYVAKWINRMLDPSLESGFVDDDADYEAKWLRPYYNRDIGIKVLLDKVDELRASNLSQLDKAKNIHDWICDIAEYDYESGPSVGDWDKIFKDGKGVCADYASAFSITAKLVGIPNIMVSGILGPEREGHLINAVYINGEWTYIDVTMNDANNSNSFFMYPMTSDTPSPNLVPYIVFASGNGYHRQIFDIETDKLMADANDPIYVEINFDTLRGTLYGVVNKQIYRSNFILPTAKAKGYTFQGWYTGEDCTGQKVTSSTKITNSISHYLYAHWKANKYTVKFNVNKGKKLKKSKRTKKVTYNGKYGKLPKPKRSGYKFKGWYTKKKGGKMITKASKVKITKTTTLYARWKKNK